MTDFPQRYMNIKKFKTYLDDLRHAFNNETEDAARQYQQALVPTQRNLDEPDPALAQNPIGRDEENLEEVNFDEKKADANDIELKTKFNKAIKELHTTKAQLRKSNIVLLYMQEEQKDILDYMKDTSYAAMDVQAKIHSCVLVTSLALSLIPTIGGELGLDYYGACSKEWHEKKQFTGIIFTILVMEISALASGIGLTYFLSQRKTRQTVFEVNQHRRLPTDENQKKMRRILTEEEEHYLKHLWLFVIFSTVFGWLLAATNIYADKMEKRGGDLENLCFIVHFLMIALQGFALLLLKLTEPMTKRAIHGALRRQSANEDGDYRQL